MATPRKQINIRIDATTESELPILTKAIADQVGIEVTNTDLFRMGISELKKRYLQIASGPKAETFGFDVDKEFGAEDDGRD